MTVTICTTVKELEWNGALEFYYILHVNDEIMLKPGSRARSPLLPDIMPEECSLSTAVLPLPLPLPPLFTTFLTIPATSELRDRHLHLVHYVC